MVPQVGQKIGPYEILGRLGTGGMGLVFSAWDSRLHRDVAIKLLREDVLTPSMRSRFLGEARAASRLNHPNICTIFDIGEEQNQPYLVMELLKGETLRGRIQRGPVSLEDILRVGTEVADALATAHEKGIVHRDIKPANIVLVDKPGGRFQTKVLDFGLAKINAEAFESGGLTTTGMTVGTVSYMSPEQARGELLDGRSDIFSLGVVLYEMATGRLPFTGATSALVFVQLLNRAPDPVRNFNSGFPREFEGIINTCLQKDRNARYESAHALVEALHKVTITPSGATKQSWISKLTPRLARTDEGPPSGPPSDAYEISSPAPEEVQEAKPAVPGDAFLRPVKRSGSTDKDRPAPKPSSPPEASSSPTNEADAPTIDGPDGSSVPLSAPAASSSPEQQPPHDISRKPIRNLSAAPVPRIVVPRLTQADLDNPTPRFQRILVDEQGFDVPSQEESARPALTGDTATRNRRIIIGIILVFLAIIASAIVLSMKHPAPQAAPPGRVMVAPIMNRTGDRALDGVVSAGLELALKQSPHIGVLGAREYGALLSSDDNAAAPSLENVQRVARTAGANTFVLGDARSDGNSYALSLHIYNAATGASTAEENETAASREQITAAIDRLATDVRSALGEHGDSIQANSLPLTREATSNLEALKAYASGEQFEAAGRPFDAMYAFQHAITLEPRFVQAHLRLAEVYRRQHAELSEASEAAQAQSNAGATSVRTRLLAQAAVTADAQGDYPQAATLLQQLKAGYPSDVEVLDRLARLQLLQGSFEEALQTAHDALGLSPIDREAATYAELALITQGNTDAAAQMLAEHPSVDGVANAPATLVAFLRGAPGPNDADGASDDLGLQDSQAAVLDGRGLFDQGLAKWKQVASHAATVPALGSAATYALTQAALDRALASDCTQALDLLHDAAVFPAGPQALFSMGMAFGLCGNVAGAHSSASALSSNYSQSFAVKRFYLSDLNALAQWKSGSAADALLTLQSAKPYDRLSLTPYLRGLVYLSDKQPQMAIVEFQSMLSHSGTTALPLPEAFPMAQLGIARAYAATGDGGNATQSYGRFLSMWPQAAPDNALLAEARASISTTATP